MRRIKPIPEIFFQTKYVLMQNLNLIFFPQLKIFYFLVFVLNLLRLRNKFGHKSLEFEQATMTL